MDRIVTGVDKIWLTSPEIRPDFKSVRWEEREHRTWVESIDLNTGEVVDEQRTSVQKFINFKDSGISVNLNSDGILIHFNPNRVLTNTHYQIRPIGEMGEAVYKVQNILKTKKLEVEISNWKSTQVDLCRQTQMDHQYEAYVPLFRQMNGRRQDNFEYPNSYYYENTQSEGVFYDKTYQAKKLFKEKVPENTMRFEQRFKGSRVVSSIMKANTIEGFEQIDIDAVFNSYAERIFKPEIQLTIHPYLSQLGQYLRSGKKDAVLKFLNHMSIASGGVRSLKQVIIENFGTMNALRHAIRIETGYYNSLQSSKSKGRERQNWLNLVRRIDAEDRFYQMNFVTQELRPINLKDELVEKFQLTA